MPLNKQKGNMYQFITHTWNVIKGECYHNCSYCYMKRWGKLNPIRFDEKELNTDLGSGNFIFVGSSNDMFAENVSSNWINKVLDYCKKFDNKYLLQTKNPSRFSEFDLDDRFTLGTTIESNRDYKNIYSNSPSPLSRAKAMTNITNPKFITIEPILDFDLLELMNLITIADASWINIGADSGNNNLPEPSRVKVDNLIKVLNGSNHVVVKKNLGRIKLVES